MQRSIPHLQELVDGTPAVGDTLRPQYDPRLPMKGRLIVKVKELNNLGMKMTFRTLQRRMQRFLHGGAAALGDRRSNGRKEEAFARADEDVISCLRKVLGTYDLATQTSYAVIRAELAQMLKAEFPHPDDRPATPSVSSVERYVKQLSGNQNPTKPADQRRTAALVPKRTFRKRAVTAPGDECQIDSTWFDAFVRMPDGEIRRPHLTTLIDKRTRSIIGFNFTDGAPTGDDHAYLLARTLVPHALRPWSDQYAKLELPEMPWAPYVNGQPHAYDTFRPYIFPRRIVIDNGQDFRSLLLLATCKRYGIHRTETPPHKPTGKPHVERHFLTIKTMFTRHLPGYVGGSKKERGNSPEKQTVLELRTVIEMFDRWVGIIWQNREHEGLIDQLNPSLVHSPNSMYAASVELTGHFMMPLGEEDYIALMPRVKRTIQTDGISFNDRTYDSPHLAPMRLQKDAEDKSIEYAVHYDRNDPSQVWVLSTQDGQWITCEWTDDAGLARPNERALLARAEELSKTRRRFDNDEAHELTIELRGVSVAEEEERRQQKIAADKAAKKQAARGRKNLDAVEPTANINEALSDYFDIEELRAI